MRTRLYAQPHNYAQPVSKKRWHVTISSNANNPGYQKIEVRTVRNPTEGGARRAALESTLIKCPIITDIRELDDYHKQVSSVQ